MNTDPISAAHAYRMALESVLSAPTLQDARKRAAKALEIRFAKPEPGVISVASGFGANSGEPFVTISIASPIETANPTAQLVSAQARQIAIQILEAADAAESDGFVIGWLRGTAELHESAVAALLNDFRAYRDRRRKD